MPARWLRPDECSPVPLPEGHGTLPLAFDDAALVARVAAHPRGLSGVLADDAVGVGVGDTFTRSGDTGGPWEAVSVIEPGRWLLRRGSEAGVLTTAERLLTPALWLRARAL